MLFLDLFPKLHIVFILKIVWCFCGIITKEEGHWKKKKSDFNNLKTKLSGVNTKVTSHTMGYFFFKLQYIKLVQLLKHPKATSFDFLQ